MGKAKSKKPTRRNHSQRPPAKAKPTSKAVAAASSKRQRIAFNAQDNVLLVGEGDFSFARSLIEHHNITSVTATCYDSHRDLIQKHPSAAKTVSELSDQAFEGFSPEPNDSTSAVDKDLNGKLDDPDAAKPSCRVLYGIDATKLSTTHRKAVGRSASFSKIVFNFPHVGGLSTDVNRQVRANQQLLVGFFNAAKTLLGHQTTQRVNIKGEEAPRPGQILVTLFEGEPYTLWNIRDLARHCNLQVVESFKFPWTAYPGYHHARTIGDITTGKDRSEDSKRKGAWRGEERDARTYVLEVKGDGASSTDLRKRRREESSDDER